MQTIKFKDFINDSDSDSSPTYIAGVTTSETKKVPLNRVFVALLNQTGSNAPVPTVLENSIGVITFSYISTGRYLLTSVGNFPLTKTFIQIQRDIDSFIFTSGDNNTISISTYAGGVLSDDMFYYSGIRIEVYP